MISCAQSAQPDLQFNRDAKKLGSKSGEYYRAACRFYPEQFHDGYPAP